jgi:FMN phosphatase YigB (HAD superfamily)
MKINIKTYGCSANTADTETITGILTNNGHQITNEQNAEIVISEEVGAAKPDPAIFDVAFARMGWPDKARVLMVGDSLTSDIAGAAAYGIDACWFNPAGKERPAGVNIRYEIQRLDELLRIVGLTE